MSFPKTVRETPVKSDGVALTVSTIQIARNYYDTVIFDDSDDKRHVGWKIGGYVIEKSNQRSETREAAMDQHREALYTARTEQPKQLVEAQSDDDASRLARVEQLVEDARDKCNAVIDTYLLLDALGLEG
jgi:hypothetical protein